MSLEIDVMLACYGRVLTDREQVQTIVEKIIALKQEVRELRPMLGNYGAAPLSIELSAQKGLDLAIEGLNHTSHRMADELNMIDQGSVITGTLEDLPLRAVPAV